MTTPRLVAEVKRPDPDALDRACENLANRFGDLAVSPPDDIGTVTIMVKDRPRTSWRFTAQDRLIAQPERTTRS